MASLYAPFTASLTFSPRPSPVLLAIASFATSPIAFPPSSASFLESLRALPTDLPIPLDVSLSRPLFAALPAASSRPFTAPVPASTRPNIESTTKLILSPATLNIPPIPGILPMIVNILATAFGINVKYVRTALIPIPKRLTKPFIKPITIFITSFKAKPIAETR